MKTFEERYTAWIDGRLEGAALAAFEQELAARADAREARLDRADAERMRLLLHAHLAAPALSNAEFFSFQVRERIDAERQAMTGRSAPAGRGWPALFAWPAVRLLGAGAACLFVALALYYGLMPQRPSSQVFVTDASKGTSHAKASSALIAEGKPPAPSERNAPPGNDLMVRNDAAAPQVTVEPAPDLAATVPDPAGTTASATTLHYKQPNVNVLWIDGLDYMPTVPSAEAASPAAETPAAATSNATAAP